MAREEEVQRKNWYLVQITEEKAYQFPETE
jgi:hypothetical protein